MSENDLEAFDAETLKHLAREQGAIAPEISKQKVLTRLSATIPSLLSTPSGHESGAEGKSGNASRVSDILAHRALRGLLLFTLGALTGAGLDAALRPNRVIYVERPQSSASPVASASLPPIIELPDTQATAPALLSTGQSRPSPSLSRESTLALERRLLDEARGAITRGEPTRAEAPLLQHQAQFPRGELREEREALMVKVLARVGRMKEARQRAVRFEREFPHSLLLSAVQSEVTKNP